MKRCGSEIRFCVEIGNCLFTNRNDNDVTEEAKTKWPAQHRRPTNDLISNSGGWVGMGERSGLDVGRVGGWMADVMEWPLHLAHLFPGEACRWPGTR